MHGLWDFLQSRTDHHKNLAGWNATAFSIEGFANDQPLVSNVQRPC